MMFQKAGEGIEGIVTDANSGAPLKAKIEVQETINVYPNPTFGVVYFEHLETLDVKSIKVFNSSGVLIDEAENTNSIDLSGFIRGIYFIQFYSQSIVSTHKIIKQ